MLSIAEQDWSDTTDFLSNFITRPHNSRLPFPVIMRVFYANEAQLHDYMEIRIHHRGTFRGVKLSFPLRNFAEWNLKSFHKFHCCPSWARFPAVMWACWSPSATTWNGYRRRKMANRGRGEWAQHGGGTNERLTNGSPSKIQLLEGFRQDLRHRSVYITENSVKHCRTPTPSTR